MTLHFFSIENLIEIFSATLYCNTATPAAKLNSHFCAEQELSYKNKICYTDLLMVFNEAVKYIHTTRFTGNGMFAVLKGTAEIYLIFYKSMVKYVSIREK
jgi:hypothetical protein